MKQSLLAAMLLSAFAGFLPAQDYPKSDLFFGYSFVRYNSAQTIPAFTANGGISTFGFNFTDHFGMEAQLGGIHNGNVNNFQFDTTAFQYLFGPRVSLGRHRRVDPYIHALFGGQSTSTSISSSSILVVNPPIAGGALVPQRFEASTNSFAMSAGGGLDIKLSRLITLRPIQLDYYLTRIEAPDVTVPLGTTPPRARNQNNLQYAAGIAFTFGRENPGPPPPAMTTCPDGSRVPAGQDCPKQNLSIGVDATQHEVCPGTVVRVSVTGTLPQHATKQWSVNGQKINQGDAFDFDATGRTPGTYKVGVDVTADGFNPASAETAITVRGYQPPVGSLTASPSEIPFGQKSALSPDFRAGQCGGPLQPPVFSASEGSVTGNEFDSSTVAFDPTNNAEQRKTVTVTAKVSDPQGSASAEAQIVVIKPAAIAAKRLPDVVFPANSARVNNCGKRVLLEELKANTDSDPTGTVYFVGHQSSTETAAGLDAARALNAAAVISAGQGVCTAFPANQIFVSADGSAKGADFQPGFCGASTGVRELPGQTVSANDENANRRVEVWFVPTNGKPPATANAPKDAASLGVANLKCPR